MILSPGRGYVFIHIPKTGGTSLALALEARAMKDDLMLGDTPKARLRRRRLKGAVAHGRLWKHSTLADIEGLVPAATLDGLFAFTLVRNPWARALSYYRWLRLQSFDHPAVRLASGLAFEGFVTHRDTRAAFRAHPYGSYMRRSDGREQCDAYIRLEHFDADAQPLLAHLGVSLLLPHVNRSGAEPAYQPVYSPLAAEAVAEACAEDVARFGYGFD
ncbi:MAG: sulfotransferase family 2 domain-containing protein [Pseudodonghicola sp.]